MFSSNATQVSAVTQAEAVDFDGTNDYLSRSTDLTGNADGKAFTFSFWVWLNDLNGSFIYNGNGRLVVRVTSGQINIYGKDTSDVDVLYFTTDVIPQNTWTHILVSLDLASTSNRYVYINDVQQTISWTTYTNTNVDRASTGTWYAPNSDLSTRVSNLFMDYTYRNLSVEANRRLFITADLKPASGQAALSPILYLPMSDPTTVGTNAGTGGNFTLTGTVARSGRGPNQYNAPYSTFDGANDFLYRSTAPTGAANSTQFTFAYNIRPIGTTERVLVITSNLIGRQIWFNSNFTASTLTVTASNSSNTAVLGMSYSPAGGFVVGRNYNVVISLDLASTSTRRVFVNGVDVTSSVSFSTYTNSAIGFGSTTYWSVASRVNQDFPSGNGSSNAYFGALWFNTSYIDLSVASNLAKFVSGTGIDAKPVDLGATGELPTGTAPLIYLPMYANNAGKNYGTGGDFTVNSGPYTGARGPNEFWGNGVTYSSTGSTLSNTSGDGASSSTFTFSVWLQATGSGAIGEALVIGFGPGNSRYIYVYWVDSGGRQMYFNNFWTGGASAVSANFAVSSTGYTHLLVSKTGNTYQCYVNGVSTTMTVTGTVGNWVDGQKYINFGSDATTQAAVGELFLTTQYFDLSQEANRLIFRDCFGNPTNLPLAITNGTLTNPKYYLRFAPGAFGTNAGTGGNFTTTGTLLDKGQY